jgi:hypothetical protein
MLPGNDEHVHGSLRVYVPERDSSRALQHPGCRYLASHDSAEKTVSHLPILTCRGTIGRPTYMVALLRTLGAPPHWCTEGQMLALRYLGALPAVVATMRS